MHVGCGVGESARMLNVQRPMGYGIGVLRKAIVFLHCSPRRRPRSEDHLPTSCKSARAE